MTKDEAMQQAIDFLDGSYEAHAVRKALQEALTQPAKEWVGLSDEEMDKIFCEVSDNCINYFPSELNVAWFKALKEKNEK